MAYYVAMYNDQYILGIFEDKAQAKCACQIAVVKHRGWNDRDKWDVWTSIDRVEVDNFDYIKMWDDMVKVMKRH